MSGNESSSPSLGAGRVVSHDDRPFPEIRPGRVYCEPGGPWGRARLQRFVAMENSWLLVACCTIVLPLLTTEMSEATVTEIFPETLKEGLEVYAKLKDDIQWALGLKKYAENLTTNIVQTFVEMNLGLDKKEKDILRNLSQAQASLDKATVVIRVMKEQTNALFLVLNPSATGTDNEKLWAAVRYFTHFIKNMEEEIQEVEDALKQASETFIISQLKLREHMQHRSSDKEAAETNYWFGAIDKIMSFLEEMFRPLMPVIWSVVEGITGGNFIEEIEEHPWQQYEYYIKGFERLSNETKALQERLGDKRQQLINIHTNLNTTGTLAEIQIEALPLQHFELIQNMARTLLEACETFFDRSKTKMLD